MRSSHYIITALLGIVLTVPGILKNQEDSCWLECLELEEGVETAKDDKSSLFKLLFGFGGSDHNFLDSDLIRNSISFFLFEANSQSLSALCGHKYYDPAAFYILFCNLKIAISLNY